MPLDLFTIYAYACGYLYGLGMGNIFVKNIVTRMHENQNERRKFSVLKVSQGLGLIEGFLFVTSLLYEKPEFIAIWLTLKTAAGWGHWNRHEFVHVNPDGERVTILGRMSFNIFLAGNGLLIAFSFIGFKLIDWLLNGMILHAIVVGIGAVFAAWFLYWILRPYPLGSMLRSVLKRGK